MTEYKRNLKTAINPQATSPRRLESRHGLGAPMRMNFSRPWILPCLVFVLLPVLCLADDVKVVVDKSVDLSNYKTYQWQATKVLTKTGVVENNPKVSPLIAESVKHQLARKGLTEVQEGADVQVATWALSDSTPQLEAIVLGGSTTFRAEWGTRPLVTIGRYNKKGTLVVNLIDPQTNKSVWAGLVTRALGKPEKLARDIDKAAAALFKKYPTKK